MKSKNRHVPGNGFLTVFNTGRKPVKVCDERRYQELMQMISELCAEAAQIGMVQKEESVKSKLQLIIERRNIKQARIAERLGVSRAAVCEQVKNGICRPSTACRYSEVIGCNPLELLEVDKRLGEWYIFLYGKTIT